MITFKATGAYLRGYSGLEKSDTDSTAFFTVTQGQNNS